VRNLFLDLETIPSQHPAVKTEIYARDAFRQAQGIGVIEADSRLKDPVKIAESIATRTAAAERDLLDHNAAKLIAADKAWRDTALDGWFGHVAIIGWAVDHHSVKSLETINVGGQLLVRPGNPSVYTLEDVSIDVSVEKARIESFFQSVGNGEFLVVGHGVRRFDILFLWQRCICLRIEPPRWPVVAKNSSRWSEEYVNDTADMCSTTLSGKPFGPALNHLCEALGIQTKGDIDGSKVWDEIAAGRIQDVAEYCQWDVRRARGVWRRIHGLPALPIDMPVLEVAA
jgi:3'-5' exonuclease